MQKSMVVCKMHLSMTDSDWSQFIKFCIHRPLAFVIFHKECIGTIDSVSPSRLSDFVGGQKKCCINGRSLWVMKLQNGIADEFLQYNIIGERQIHII